MATVRVALANLKYPASAEESVSLACAAIAEAARNRASIVCFPECYVPGYRIGKSTPAPGADFLSRAWERVARQAAESNITVLLGTERMVDDSRRITVLVINADGSTAGFQDKVQLDPTEDSTYTPASSRQVFTAGPLTFGIVICHEGWRYPETVRWAARRGAQVVFHPHFGDAEPGSYRPTVFGDPRNTFHEQALRCRAAENTCYFASVNCASEGSPTTSAVIAPDGEVIAWQPYGQEGLLIADIDTSAATGLL